LSRSRRLELPRILLNLTLTLVKQKFISLWLDYPTIRGFKCT
jgi:hypothetical protein